MEQTKAENTISTNQPFIYDANFMQMRLDVNPLIEDIKNFLSSRERKIVQKQDGSYIEEYETIGLPLANQEGIMRLCNLVKMRVNHQIVQGNLKEDHYWDFIARARKEITETVVKKCYDWEILDSNLNMVIDEICAMIEIYLTRPVDNQERDSYNAQFKSNETVINNEKKRSIMNFAGGMGGQ